MHLRLFPISILLVVISAILAITLISSQISIAQQTANSTISTIDISKLSGNEKIEITGGFGTNDSRGAHELDYKPLIKIDGNILNYEIADPSRVGFISIPPNGHIYYDQEIKVPVNADTSKIMTVLYSHSSNTLQEKPDKTIYRSDNESLRNYPHHISTGDKSFKNIVEYMEVNKQDGTGAFRFVN